MTSRSRCWVRLAPAPDMARTPTVLFVIVRAANRVVSTAMRPRIETSLVRLRRAEKPPSGRRCVIVTGNDDRPRVRAHA